MLSKLLRRTHMYLALFLTPWVLMYALSTIVMNHRGSGESTTAYVPEREITWTTAPVPVPADRTQAIPRLLQELGLDGAHSVSQSPATVTVLRQDAVSPRRITWTLATNRVVVERQDFRMPAFLERLHRRRGYQHPYGLEDTWAFSVDTFIFALIFWGASGLWLWWEMKRTRLAGAVCILGGVAAFAFFVAFA